MLADGDELTLHERVDLVTIRLFIDIGGMKLKTGDSPDQWQCYEERFLKLTRVLNQKRGLNRNVAKIDFHR